MQIQGKNVQTSRMTVSEVAVTQKEHSKSMFDEFSHGSLSVGKYIGWLINYLHGKGKYRSSDNTKIGEERGNSYR